MASKHLKQDPIKLRDDNNKQAWMYELPHGLEVYARDVRANTTVGVVISWARIRSALKRKDRPRDE